MAKLSHKSLAVAVLLAALILGAATAHAGDNTTYQMEQFVQSAYAQRDDFYGEALSLYLAGAPIQNEDLRNALLDGIRVETQIANASHEDLRRKLYIYRMGHIENPERYLPELLFLYVQDRGLDLRPQAVLNDEGSNRRSRRRVSDGE